MYETMGEDLVIVAVIVDPVRHQNQAPIGGSDLPKYTSFIALLSHLHIMMLLYPYR